jgi:chromosome segregation ATPase
LCNLIVSTDIRSLILHSTAILNTATVNLSQSNLVVEDEKSTQTAYQSQITDLKPQLAELLKQEAEAEAQFIASTGKLEQQHSANSTLLETESQAKQAQENSLNDKRTIEELEEQILLQKQQLRRQQPSSHPLTPNVHSTAEATPQQRSTEDDGIKELQSQLSKLLLQLSSGESELYKVKHQRLITEAALDKSEMQRDLLNQSVEHEKSRVTELQASMKQLSKELEEQRHQIKSLELEKVHATELDRLLKTSEAKLEDQRQKVAKSQAWITQLEEIVRQAGMQLKQQQQNSHNEEIRLKDLEEQLQRAEREVLVSRRNLKSKQN